MVSRFPPHCFPLAAGESLKMTFDCHTPGEIFMGWNINQHNDEPPHDKTNKMTVRPAKAQISLGIRPV